jgi:hypothetical protein
LEFGSQHTIQVAHSAPLGIGESTVKQRRFHVVFNKPHGLWEVRVEGRTRPLDSFRTKAVAVYNARFVAKALHGQLIVHLKNGRIQEKRDYEEGATTTVAHRRLQNAAYLFKHWAFRPGTVLTTDEKDYDAPASGGGYGGPRRGP